MESIAAEQNGRLEPLDQRAPRRLRQRRDGRIMIGHRRRGERTGTKRQGTTGKAGKGRE